MSEFNKILIDVFTTSDSNNPYMIIFEYPKEGDPKAYDCQIYKANEIGLTFIGSQITNDMLKNLASTIVDKKKYPKYIQRYINQFIQHYYIKPKVPLPL